MRRLWLLAVVLILATSVPTFGAIVYSGSQNVTLQLEGGDNPPSQQVVIPIADSGGDWDDFLVVLSFDGMMMGMSHLVIYSPMGMAMGGIVGLTDFVTNLNRGETIGPDSPMLDWGNLANYDSGEFGPEGGYIGIIMDIPDGSPHYGWLHMSSQWDMGTSLHGVMFDGWAYEDQAYTPIAAGQIPEPGSFVLCSIGVLAVWLRRRRVL
jgi:hypothetical protein